MSDLSSALIAWCKLPGIIDQDIESFRDVVNINEFIETYEAIFHEKLEGDDVKLRVRQMIKELNDKVPKNIQNDKKIPEINIDYLVDCDFIELENVAQLFVLAKQRDKEHKEEFTDMLNQLKGYDKEEIENLISLKGHSQAEIQMLVAKARAYANVYDQLLKNRNEIEELQKSLEDESGNSIKAMKEKEIMDLLEGQKTNIKNLEEEISNLKVQKKEKREENAKLEESNKTNFKILLEQEQEKEKLLNGQIAEIDQKLSEMPELKEKIKELENEEKQVKEELKEKRKEKEEIEKRLQEKREKLKAAEARKEKIDQQNQKTIEEEERKVEEAKQSVINRKAELEALKTSPAITAAIEKLNNARKERDEKKEAIKKIIEEMQVIKESLEQN